MNELLRDFECLRLYPSAMWNKASIYPKIETGNGFTRVMNDDVVEKYNIQSFTQGSAVLKNKNYNPENLIVQHLPVKERLQKKLKLTVCEMDT